MNVGELSFSPLSELRHPNLKLEAVPSSLYFLSRHLCGMEIYSPAGPLPPVPDNLTVPQFIFDYEHASRPARSAGIPWLIEDETGRKIGEHEVSRTTPKSNHPGAINSPCLTYSFADAHMASPQPSDPSFV